jgi:hypothetical protein
VLAGGLLASLAQRHEGEESDGCPGFAEAYLGRLHCLSNASPQGRNQGNRRGRAIAALCLFLCLIMFAGQRLTYPASNHVEWPGQMPRNRWQQAFLWIRANTPQDAVFALDNDYMESPGEDAQGFRATAQRSAIADWYKDGGIAANFPQAALPWWQGSQATGKLNRATDQQRLARLAPLGATWMVLPAQALTSFACPYTNAQVRVCRLPLLHRMESAKYQ